MTEKKDQANLELTEMNHIQKVHYNTSSCLKQLGIPSELDAATPSHLALDAHKACMMELQALNLLVAARYLRTTRRTPMNCRTLHHTSSLDQQ